MRAPSVRNEIENRHPHHDNQSGAKLRMPGYLRDEPHPVFDRAAVFAGPVVAPAFRVPEIPRARLGVHELIPTRVGKPRRGRVIVDDALDVSVGEHVDAAGKAFVENRMMTTCERRRRVPYIGAREAPGVCDLQAEIQIAVRVGSEAITMRRDQLIAEPGMDAVSRVQNQ